MEIEKYLDNYISKNIDLNETRLKRLHDAERIMREFLEKDDVFGNSLVEVISQGSYRQGTLIKPVDEEVGFDVDLLIVLNPIDEWGPKDYLANLANSFQSDGNYKDITDTVGKTRCVTIDYEGEFHIDLVPAIVDGSHYKICNKNTDEFEDSDGDGYADWFAEKNALTNGYLIDIVRLLKYLRDSENKFDSKSIILTTLITMQVSEQDAVSGLYDNLYSTLNTLLINFDDYLQQFNTPPSIPNPAMPEKETFDRHWKNDTEGFVRLKNTVSKYRIDIETSFTNSDTSVVKKHLINVFGDNFFTSEELSTKQAVTPSPFKPYAPHAQLRR